MDSDKVSLKGPRECLKLRNSECEQLSRNCFLDLVPVVLEVAVLFDFHRLIIGRSGRDVRTLISKYDVHITLSSAKEKQDLIEIIGRRSCVEDAKEAALERCRDVEGQKPERELKSYELKFEFDPEYHPKRIGRRGAVIKKIRTDHDVQVNFPHNGDPNEHIMTITCFEKNAHDARDEILKMISDMYGLMTREKISINSAVHSRLIGARGKNIRKIMVNFKGDINFPRKDDSDPDLVVIIGPENNVTHTKDHLLNVKDEYIFRYFGISRQFRKPATGPDIAEPPSVKQEFVPGEQKLDANDPYDKDDEEVLLLLDKKLKFEADA